MSEKKPEQNETPVELSDSDVEQAVGGVKNSVGAGPKTSIYERPDARSE